MDRNVFIALPAERRASRFRVVEKEDEKVIAGKTCRHYFLQGRDDLHYDVWVDTKHLNPLTDVFPGLKHLPLVYEADRDGIHMRFTAMSMTEQPLDETYFLAPTNAVRISEDVLQKVMR
jgi:hypothetical protein